MWDQVACQGIKRGNIRPLVAVTPETGMHQVGKGCRAAMLFADDVIRLMRRKDRVFGDTAVLAAVPGAIDNSTTQRYWYHRPAQAGDVAVARMRARIKETISSSKMI